jgi:hypothetical protein
VVRGSELVYQIVVMNIYLPTDVLPIRTRHAEFGRLRTFIAIRLNDSNRPDIGPLK